MTIPDSHAPLNRLSLFYLALTFLGGAVLLLANALGLFVLAFISFIVVAVGVFSGGGLVAFLFIRNASWLLDWRRDNADDARSVVDGVRLGTVLRALLGLAAAVLLYIPAALLIAEGMPPGWTFQAALVATLCLGAILAVLTVLGPRAAPFESLIASASKALTKTRGGR